MNLYGSETMNKTWHDAAWKDYLYWQGQDRKTLKRINKLIDSIDRNAFDGIGKPEPLKHRLQGYWSVRIDGENRLVYKIENDVMFIAQCKGHYDELI